MNETNGNAQATARGTAEAAAAPKAMASLRVEEVFDVETDNPEDRFQVRRHGANFRVSVLSPLTTAQVAALELLLSDVYRRGVIEGRSQGRGLFW